MHPETLAVDSDTFGEEVAVLRVRDCDEIVVTAAAAVDTTALTAAIEQAEALTESDYTASTWAAMQTALTSAKSVLSDADATQTQVDEAIAALNSAIDALEAPVSEETQEELKTTVSQVSVLIQTLTQSGYTTESWDAVQTALAAANAVLSDPDASQSEVEAAIAALNSAVAALEAVTTVDTTALTAAIEAAGALAESSYTADSWAALQTALTSA
ncbi:MAG: FIVAR domain-containing protein [Clostridiales bacterium]|nr:FIVAR domain-containing protein [Clostridiales bacterium]